MARIPEPELKILFEEGEVTREESIRVATLIINEMLHWDYSEATTSEAMAS
ncbi:MAG: hypothetical protein IJ681_00245 [Bacteroidales bacterium]|nr:hypothetical protein [Bacteroidales bacterium]